MSKLRDRFALVSKRVSKGILILVLAYFALVFGIAAYVAVLYILGPD